MPYHERKHLTRLKWKDQCFQFRNIRLFFQLAKSCKWIKRIQRCLSPDSFRHVGGDLSAHHGGRRQCRRGRSVSECNPVNIKILNNQLVNYSKLIFKSKLFYSSELK